MPFRVPAGIKLVRVDAKSGMRAGPGDGGRTILEAFKPGTAPPDNYAVIGVADAIGVVSMLMVPAPAKVRVCAPVMPPRMFNVAPESAPMVAALANVIRPLAVLVVWLALNCQTSPVMKQLLPNCRRALRKPLLSSRQSSPSRSMARKMPISC